MAGLGLSNAVSQFFGAQRAAADDVYRERVRKSQTQQLDDEDARIADVNAARQRGADVMARYQTTQEQQPMGLGLAEQPAPMAALPGMGSTQPVPAQGAAPGAVQGAAPMGLSTGQPKRAAANPDHILEAFDATTTELAKRGRWDDWAKSWQKGAALRDTLRTQALDKAEGQYRMSGDPTVFAKEAYRYIDDGFEFVKGEKTAGPDGKPAFNVTRRNRETGAEETRPMTGEELMRGVAFARDPQAVREAEAKHAMEVRKAAMERQKLLDEEGIKQPGRIQLENLKGDRAREIARMTDDRMRSEGAANRGVSMRGQNMSDARARATVDATLGKPFEVTGEDGKPVLVQMDKKGGIVPVAGYSPKGAAEKPLPGPVMKQLTEARDNAATIDRLTTSFKGDYAGKGAFGVGADMSMIVKGNIGTDKDAVEWWKNYRKESELVERHALFGAALTPGEQASWRSSDIGPGMNAAVVERNLKTRAALARKVAENTRADLIDAGHSETRVNAISGRKASSEVGSGTDLGGGFKVK